MVNNMSLTVIEEEVVILKAIYELINSMVNFEMFSLSGVDPDSQAIIKSSTHQRLFNIFLVDLLSSTDNDKNAPIESKCYLTALNNVIESPSFNINNSIIELRGATKKFSDWLNMQVDVKIWLPSLYREATLNILRIDFLKICGDISKHNFLRLIRVAKKLMKLFEASGIHVDIKGAIHAIEDFYMRFHDDIFNYHCSTIAEFLNNIRWGIIEYLKPEYKRSYSKNINDSLSYSYDIPRDIQDELAKTCYWELMNQVRSPPSMRRFITTKYLKYRY